MAIVPREPREIDDEEIALVNDWWQEVWRLKKKNSHESVQTKKELTTLAAEFYGYWSSQPHVLCLAQSKETDTEVRNG